MPEYLNTRRPYVIIIIAVFFFFGIYIGFHNGSTINKIVSVSNKETPDVVKADFSDFWKVWNLINEKYPDSALVSDEDRVNGAISGLVSSLNDPYSMFLAKDEAKSFEEDINGSFSGIGMEVGIKDKVLTVISPIKNTPAYNAGFKPGDKILKIDEVLTSELSIDEAIKLIRGEKNTTVALTIFRDGENEPKEIKVVRDIINIPTLDYELRTDSIFVVKLYTFSANSSELFGKAMQDFYKSKSDKLLLDLRGNPGGYLDSAVSISSWFLEQGKPVLIEDAGHDQKQKIYRSSGKNIFGNDLKFVILIDAGSASASEIVAGAMQDYGIAKLVGEKSYGKGSVQQVLNISTDSLLKVTIAKWLTPKGNSISEKGLLPDYVVEFTKKDIESKKDVQMEKAVELLNNWE